MPGLVTRDLSDQLVQSSPVRLVIDLNESCNLRCTYCHIDALFAPQHPTARELPLDAFVGLLGEAEAMRVFEVTLTGGEVTTMKGFAKYLDALAVLRYPAAQLITNGTTLTERTAHAYRDSGLTRLSVSIDGFASVNDEHRGRGTFGKALRGLTTAVRHGIPVNVISVLSRNNWRGWYEFSAFLRDQGVRTHNISLVCRLGRAENMLDWIGIDAAQVAELESDFVRRSPALNDGAFTVTLNTGAIHAGQWDGLPMPVHQLQDVMAGTEAVVKLNGDVHTNRIVGKRGAIGNVYRSTLEEVWATSRGWRRGTVADLTANPDQTAQDYYHLRGSSEAGTNLARPAGADGIRRRRTLPSGDVLEFAWDDFTVRLIPRRP